ncbi:MULTISPECIES: MaoC family dehydratase [Acinetobacter calcoaceticus/baumannii complex]|uniref:MaoC family dehydratase n=1 Tax=Acinetobacter calcoaceticus/baumannii complex TaxID=909768 RepID=UPI0015803B4F|nr:MULTISPECIES: MaoC family dehydratase [Acinetobacter calcoaceticus/baumannii complex]NUF83702.1 MaoC family dehydratase [Acinetobacter seifertii]NUG51104.1 MaoC family dehydratase [Acinetobacter lactucae]
MGDTLSNKTPISIAQLFELQGEVLGMSDWITIDQATINAFADVTRDWQYIHVDTEAASKSPFGGTIAHGFLTLSLLSAMALEALPQIKELTSSINYGMNNLRFIHPVHSGKSVRGQFLLKSLKEKSLGRYQMVVDVSVEIENETKPALVAEWLSLLIL